MAFAMITARAFADLAELIRLSRHLLQAGGHWLAMKGVCPQAEVARLPADVVLDAIHRLEVPGVTGERHLVRISKSCRRALRGSLIWQEYSR
jgi:16S rRNA (guanine527-N7)-methyltransferase